MSMHHSTTNTRRILAWILSIAMLLGQMPLSAIAEGVEEILPEPAVTEEVYVEAETEIVPVMEPVLVEEEPAAVIVQATEEPANSFESNSSATFPSILGIFIPHLLKASVSITAGPPAWVIIAILFPSKRG